MRARLSLITVLALVFVSCSTDSLPTNWSPVYDDPGVFGGPGDQAMSDVAVFGDRVIAVGSTGWGGDADATAWISLDGTTWIQSPPDEVVLGGPGDQGMTGVVMSGPGLVAVGTDSAGGDVDAAVWTSSDGETWTRVPHNETVFGGDADQTMWAVAVGGPGFVAVGTDYSGGDADIAVWTSSDGETWTRVPHNETVFGGDRDQWAMAMAAGNLGVVVVGSDEADGYGDAAVWTSPDGLTWTRVPNETGSLGGLGAEGMFAVAMGGPGVIAAGFSWVGPDEYHAAVWTSPDGTAWTRVPDSPTFFGQDPNSMLMRGLAVTDGGVVGVGQQSGFGYEGDPMVWTSPDGMSWTRVTDPEGNLVRPGWQTMAAVVAGPNGLVAVGTDGAFTVEDVDAAVWVAPRK